MNSKKTGFMIYYPEGLLDAGDAAVEFLVEDMTDVCQVVDHLLSKGMPTPLVMDPDGAAVPFGAVVSHAKMVNQVIQILDEVKRNPKDSPMADAIVSWTHRLLSAAAIEDQEAVKEIKGEIFDRFSDGDTNARAQAFWQIVTDFAHYKVKRDMSRTVDEIWEEFKNLIGGQNENHNE